jgi:uncharacterized membrane protein HdeD (DUF308 family)
MSGMAEVRQLRPRRRRWWRQWPIAVVLAGVAASLAVIALDRFRLGSLMLAGSLVLAFILRLVLPSDRAGMLAVRSKRVDLVVLGVLGAALAVISLSVPPPP